MSHMRMSHVTHVNEACHKCEWHTSRHTMRRDLNLQFYLNLKFDLNLIFEESFHSCKWVVTPMWMTYVTQCEWVMSHIWMSHVAHMNEACRTYEWVMSHMRMSHVTHENESCHTCKWGVPQMGMTHVTSHNETWLQLKFHRVIEVMFHCVTWCTSFMCVMWLIHLCDVTHSFVW